MQAAYKAAEIAETRRQDHLHDGKSFISESTFSHPSKLELIQEAKDAGFRVAMYHVNVRNPALSVSRVAHRVSGGGHDVPEEKIRERYERNQSLIRSATLKSDRAYVYDNSALNRVPARAIDFKHGQVVRVADNVPAWARELYAKELEAFSPARLNPAAASFADAKAIVARTARPDAQLRVADPGKPYSGEIVGETTLHWVQPTGPVEHVAHFKSRLGPDVRIGNLHEVAYSRTGVASAQRLNPVEPATAGTPTEGQLREAADRLRASLADLTKDPCFAEHSAQERRAVGMYRALAHAMARDAGKPFDTPAFDAATSNRAAAKQLPMPVTARTNVQAAIAAPAPVVQPQRNPGPDRGR